MYAYDSFWVPYIKIWTGDITTTYTEIKNYTWSLHENSRLYTSREYDRETHLYFLRARYYSPTTGKFISRDPIGQNDQINLYTYVANSPVMYVDLMGLEKILIMYSPNHWWEREFIKTFSENLEAYLIKKYEGKKVNIVRIKVENADDFNNALNEFNSNESKTGQIYYLWHNQWWLSKNMTDDAISKLPQIVWDVSMKLLSCITIADEEKDGITWSNQIAQKLANKLNIPVEWSSQNVAFQDKSTKYYAPESSWGIAQPWWKIKPKTGFLEKALKFFSF